MMLSTTKCPMLLLGVLVAFLAASSANAAGHTANNSMPMPTNMTNVTMRGEGAMLVNMTITYSYDPSAMAANSSNSSNSNSSNATTETRRWLQEEGEDDPIMDTDAMLREDYADELMMQLLYRGPTDEEAESLVRHTLVYYFGFYAEEYPQNIFALTPQTDTIMTSFFNETDNTTLVQFDLTVVSMLNFSELPMEDEALANATEDAAMTTEYWEDYVRPSGPWFNLTNVIVAVAMAAQVLEPNTTNTSMPSFMPSVMPSVAPSISARPTQQERSRRPSSSPSISPEPSTSPSTDPSRTPSANPSRFRTSRPSASPSTTTAPSFPPSEGDGTDSPSFEPTATQAPSFAPTDVDDTAEPTSEATSSEPPSTPEIACPSDIQTCSDGSTVVRIPPDCDFEECPPETGCPSDIQTCPGGSSVVRQPPDCEFEDCPAEIGCPSDIQTCPDGSSVVRVGPDCEFEECPATEAVATDEPATDEPTSSSTPEPTDAEGTDAPTFMPTDEEGTDGPQPAGNTLFEGDCSSSDPCGQCEGDCDSNDDCQSGLICFNRPGNSVVAVPGCSGSGAPGGDYCTADVSDATLRLRRQRCTSSNPCAACTGDCGSDDDCEDGLQCGQNPTTVPGCVGTAVSGLDYCHIRSRRPLLRKV